MAKSNACIAISGRPARSRPCLTPSQVRAYLLARETLRRLGRAAAGVRPPPAEARE